MGLICPRVSSEITVEVILCKYSRRGRIIASSGKWRPHMCTDVSTCARRWAEAPLKIARMTLTIKLDGNWSSFQLANNTPPLSVTGSVIAPSARMRSKASSPQRHGHTGPTQCFGWHGPGGPENRRGAQKHLSAPLRQALLPMPTRQWHHSVHFITHQSFAFY